MLKKFISILTISTATMFWACGDDSSSSAPEESTDTPSNETAAWKEYCMEAINKYRSTEDSKPYTLADKDKQDCADKQSADDLKSKKAHGNFGACKEFAQNSGPNIDLSRYESEKEIVDQFLDMMWNEKKLVESGERDPKSDKDFPYIGHYLNMSSSKYSSVACGMAKSSDGKTGWLNINFY